jgi:hypothetical protein
LWAVDDPYEPNEIRSLMPGSGLVEVDAAGLYATLMRYDLYSKHEFKPFGDSLGPDFEMGIQLRRSGYKNYADFDVWLEHMRPDGTVLTRSSTNPVEMRFDFLNGRWNGSMLK